MFDREKVNNELEKVNVTNCSHSVHQVLKAGGVAKPTDVFSYHTPSGTNAFFQSHPSVTAIPITKDDEKSKPTFSSEVQ